MSQSPYLRPAIIIVTSFSLWPFAPTALAAPFLIMTSFSLWDVRYWASHAHRYGHLITAFNYIKISCFVTPQTHWICDGEKDNIITFSAFDRVHVGLFNRTAKNVSVDFHEKLEIGRSRLWNRQELIKFGTDREYILDILENVAISKVT